MKKTIMFLGVLSLGLAQAQQGNVGINTDEPKATLEIKPTATNLAGTTNEGIVAPKLSKTRVAAITDPVEGTLVYVTDEAASTIASYTGNDVKVAKIDEKGYYFFDGTEWVKTSNEWVYKSTDNRIYLKRSGDTNGTFKNSIFYNADTGQYVDIDDENNIRGVRLVANNRNVSFEETTSTLSNDIKFKNYIHSESANMHSSINRNAGGLETTYKQLEQKSLIATETDKTQRLAINSNSITVPPKNANDFVSVNGMNAGIGLYGTGDVNSSVANSGSVTISNSQSVKNTGGYIAGQLGTAIVNTSGQVANVYGTFGRLLFQSPIGAQVTTAAGGFFQTRMPSNDNSLIQNYYGNRISATQNSKNTGVGTSIAGIYSELQQAGKTKYPNMYGIYTSSTLSSTATAPDNHYGIYVASVQGGAKTNYAIYTNKGKIGFGDEVEVKSTIKVADNIADANCTPEKAGTIRFDATAKKFQGCTGTEWKDLHN